MFKESKNQVHCTLWLLLYKTVKKIKKKEIGELNFGINYTCTLQQTNAMLKILNVVINVSLKHTVHTSSYHEPNHFIRPLKTSNEAVNLSTPTKLNHGNSTVCERVISSQQRSFCMSMRTKT